MFTPAGGQSRAKRVTRTSRLAATDQPAVSLVGPPSYSYGSPNSGLPITPTLRDTGLSIASAFNNASPSVAGSVDGDDVASQYSTTSSRTPRRGRRLSVQEAEASQNRRRSLRSASKSVDLSSIAETTGFEDSGAISLDYDVTQSSLDKTYDSFDERPSKVTQYDDEDSQVDEPDSFDEGKTLSEDITEPASHKLMDTIDFLRFLAVRILSYPVRFARNTIYQGAKGISALARLLWRNLFWILPVVLAIFALPFLIKNVEHIMKQPLGNSTTFKAPTEWPSSVDELINRLTRVEQSLDSQSSFTNDIASQMRDRSISVDSLHARIADLTNGISRLEGRLSDMDANWMNVDHSLKDITSKTQNGDRQVSHDQLDELEAIKNTLREQKEILDHVMQSEKDNHDTKEAPSSDPRIRKVEVLSQPDYASYLAGARVNPFLTSQTYMHRPVAAIPRFFSRIFGDLGSVQSHPPAMAIHPSNEVGMCWAFPGHSGQLSVKLSHAIHLTDIAVEHVHQDVALDSSTAPKDIEVWGQVSEDHVELFSEQMDKAARLVEAKEPPAPAFVHLMDVTYNVYDPLQSVQVFAVPRAIKQLSVPFRQLIYRVKTNWGNEDFTCIYRVRAIGQKSLEPVAGIEDDETF